MTTNISTVISMRKILWSCVLAVFATLIATAQNEDPVLFWVEDEAVPTSEFMYIYNKNNAGSSDYSPASVREYLDLYKKFKLKVHHARALKMDTISRLNKELAGYREQLAASYLNDNSVMGRLASEAYQRMKQEAEVSHILIKLPKNPSPKDTSHAYRVAMEIYDSLISGNAEFEDAAERLSQDDKNKNNGGYIGYVRAILPKGYYLLESAIYDLVPNNISKPVRSPRGYHIVKLHSLRKAQPEVEIAHILVKKKKKSKDNHANERKRIADMHHRLVRGVPFEDMAGKESEDRETAKKAGRIGFIKTGKYDPEFEKVALALPADGSISEPIETRVGFHILKRLGVKEELSFQDSKRRIENDLRRTERAQLARTAMIDRIKKEEGIKINVKARNKLFHQIDESTFFTYRWKKPDNLMPESILTFNNGYSKSSSDFMKYLETHPKERLRLKPQSKTQALYMLFDDFVSEACLDIEKQQLEKKYPEFASLMREYEEGILLFEITKDNVWDKASVDTMGLKKYFEAHRKNYVHPEKIEVTTYTVSNSDAKKVKKVAKQLKKKTATEIAKMYPNYPADEDLIVRTSENADEYMWKVGKVTAPKPLGDDGTAFTLSKTTKLIPAQPKALHECRGYVIADYQETLEKNWIKELESLYTVKENASSVQKIIKK